LQCALQGWDVGRAACGGLTAGFFIAVVEDTYQRAGAELLFDGLHVAQALGLAEGADEAAALGAGTAHEVPFGDDDGPGKDAESEQDEEDGFGDGAALRNHVKDFAASIES